MSIVALPSAERLDSGSFVYHIKTETFPQPCERVVLLKNPVPADLLPGLISHLTSHLMYITGQMPLMVDPAQEPGSFDDRIVARQIRQFRNSLMTFQERLAQTIRELRPMLEAGNVYVTLIILLGPSAAAPRRLFAFQIPVHLYSSSPTIAGRAVTVTDYMRLIAREIQGLSISMDQQPYRCYLLLCEDAVITITTMQPTCVSLSSQAHNLARHEKRTVNSIKNVVSYSVIRFLLNVDDGAQSLISMPTVPFAGGVWLLASVRGFAAFSSESDQDADPC